MYFKISNAVEIAEKSDVNTLFSVPAKLVVVDGKHEVEEFCATIEIVVSNDEVEKMKPDCINLSLKPKRHYIQWHETEVDVSNADKQRLAMHVENSIAELMTCIQAYVGESYNG